MRAKSKCKLCHAREIKLEKKMLTPIVANMVCSESGMNKYITVNTQ